jgi:methylmalonyl-CoA mutase N-terminal domain/subunit
MGGAARAIEMFQEEIHRAAYEHQRGVERDEIGVVGVNRYRIDEQSVRIEQAAFAELESGSGQASARCGAGGTRRGVTRAGEQCGRRPSGRRT